MGRTGIKILIYGKIEQVTKDFITRVRIFSSVFLTHGSIVEE